MSADVATALEGTWFKDVTRILQASREAPAGHRRGPDAGRNRQPQGPC